MSPEKAVTQPRAHHQWLPNLLYLEPELTRSFEAAMKKRGHEVKDRKEIGVSQVVARTPAELKAMSDPRKHGQAAGY